MSNYDAIYRYALNLTDLKRIEKLIAAHERGDFCENNYFAEVRKLCKSVRSDHALNRWQILAEKFYELCIEQS